MRPKVVASTPRAPNLVSSLCCTNECCGGPECIPRPKQLSRTRKAPYTAPPGGSRHAHPPRKCHTMGGEVCYQNGPGRNSSNGTKKGGDTNKSLENTAHLGGIQNIWYFAAFLPNQKCVLFIFVAYIQNSGFLVTIPKLCF